jgi:hypothetical protein
MAKRATDLTGQRIGRWTVIERKSSNPKQTRWLVRCACGTEMSVAQYELTSGQFKSCGCARGDGYKPSAVLFKPIKKPEPAPAFTQLDAVDSAAVRAGRIAWQRIRGHQLNDLARWAEIGRAIKVGQRLAEAHRRRFNGFQLAMRAWLEENGLDGIDPVTRHDAVDLADNWPEVSEWYESLEPTARTFSSPGYTMREWRAAKLGKQRTGGPISRRYRPKSSRPAPKPSSPSCPLPAKTPGAKPPPRSPRPMGSRSPTSSIARSAAGCLMWLSIPPLPRFDLLERLRMPLKHRPDTLRRQLLEADFRTYNRPSNLFGQCR